MKDEKVSRKMRFGRKKSGLALRQLAEKAGISLFTLQSIETGKSSPSVLHYFLNIWVLRLASPSDR